jgi:hypothetical protein
MTIDNPYRGASQSDVIDLVFKAIVVGVLCLFFIIFAGDQSNAFMVDDGRGEIRGASAKTGEFVCETYLLRHQDLIKAFGHNVCTTHILIRVKLLKTFNMEHVSFLSVPLPQV